MGRVPRSPSAPCSALPLYPRLITRWTVKYISQTITNDKLLIKSKQKENDQNDRAMYILVRSSFFLSLTLKP